MTDRWAWAEVDLGAIDHNVRTIRERVAPSALWAVVKADAYGHGAVPVARAALAAGAEGLGVALTQEGVELRCAGIDAPIIVLSQQPPDDASDLVRHRLVPTVYTLEGAAALDAAVARAGAAPHPVHVKVDTGMRRAGASPQQAMEVVAAVERAAGLRLEGIFTHLAIADEPADPFTSEQLAALDGVLASLSARGPGSVPALVHAANSAGSLAYAGARRSLVRIGIAMYGITPGPGVADLVTDLRPAMTLRARVSLVKRVATGDRISYGLTHTFSRDTNVATVPIGYADGVPRRLSNVGEVLIGGRRRRIVGVVTMDQLMVDCGDDPVEVGDDVVLLGRQGDEAVRPEEWAALTGTIGYEIVCAISGRISRSYVSTLRTWANLRVGSIGALFELRTTSVAGTHAVAGVVAALARPGDLLVLAGEMGSGKTAFAQGFGRALGVTEPITSPTFTLVHSYDSGRVVLHHADLYRLDRMAEVADLALGELLEDHAIVLVEWGDVIANSLGAHLEVRLLRADGGLDGESDDSRIVHLRAVGRQWTSRWERLEADLGPWRVPAC